jgi:hypothetical protein
MQCKDISRKLNRDDESHNSPLSSVERGNCAASDKCLCNKQRGVADPSNVLDVDDLAVGVKSESLLCDRCLDWVLGVEDFVEFLELDGR